MNRGLVGALLFSLLSTSLFGSVEEFPPSWIEAARAFPVEAEGRILPLDTWSKVVYARLSGRDNDGEAIKWFLSVILGAGSLESQPFILVNDPTILVEAGVTPAERGRFSPRDLAGLSSVLPQWIEAYANDPSPGGKERLRLAQAINLYRGLSATFQFEDPLSMTSALRSIEAEGHWLNPAQAVVARGVNNNDRLALLLFWKERSLQGAWVEAAQAIEAASGQEATLELLYNKVPWAAIVALLGALALLGLSLPGNHQSSLPRLLVGSTWLIVGLWILVRMILSGRPPVTTLASTFLLVSFLLLGWAFWLSFRNDQKPTTRLAVVSGALMPWVALAFQAGSDPFSPLQAVLNTNFWLTIHVTAIIGGYATTLAGGLVGHAYLWTAGRRRGGSGLGPLWKNLRWLLFAALALTLVGTLLGGVWADQSWGRFWGWDPKENGALLIVLWLALTLHLKPSGLAQEWGTALAASFALPVLLFSWLGVNLLGQGFHSYGAAPDKVMWFLATLALDALVLAALILRKVLR